MVWESLSAIALETTSNIRSGDISSPSTHDAKNPIPGAANHGDPTKTPQSTLSNPNREHVQAHDKPWIFTTPGFILVGGIGAFLACFTAALHIAHHIRNWYDNTNQRYQVWICRIILLVPVFAACSFFCLLMPASRPVWEVIQDTYEGYAIYAFLQLHINFLGGDDRIAMNLEAGRGRMKWAFPCNCLRPFQPTTKTFNIIRIGVMQYVVLRPLGGIVAAIFALQGAWDEGSMNPRGGYFWVFMLNNTSVLFALYFLAMFYLIVEEDLQPFKPVSKFLLMKFMIWLPWAQGLFFIFLGHLKTIGEKMSYKDLTQVEQCIICLEMFLMSIAFVFVFPVDDLWKLTEDNPEVTRPLNTILAGGQDFAKEFHKTVSTKTTASTMKMTNVRSSAFRNQVGDESDHREHSTS